MVRFRFNRFSLVMLAATRETRKVFKDMTTRAPFRVESPCGRATKPDWPFGRFTPFSIEAYNGTLSVIIFDPAQAHISIRRGATVSGARKGNRRRGRRGEQPGRR